MEPEMKQATDSFIQAILSSREYRNYARERDKVKQYPELKAQIDAYRKQNYEIQTNKETPFERIEQFEREYMGFRENPLVSDFLEHELAFCRLMQQINIDITAALEFE